MTPVRDARMFAVLQMETVTKTSITEHRMFSQEKGSSELRNNKKIQWPQKVFCMTIFSFFALYDKILNRMAFPFNTKHIL